MIEVVAWIIFAVVLGFPMSFAVLRVVAETRAKWQLDRKSAATRRTEVIHGKEFTVVTQTRPVVREKRTGRTGIALERGAESDPTTVAGEIVLKPRWIKVQFARKTDGKAGRVEWRRFEKFHTVGAVDVDFVTHRAGLFRSESFIRYPRGFERASSAPDLEHRHNGGEFDERRF